MYSDNMFIQPCLFFPRLQVPRLPNECWLMVIEYLWGDLKTLHTLLQVNKLFFKAAVPLLYHSPIDMWPKFFYNGKPRRYFVFRNLVPARKKLMDVVIASAIHSRRSASPNPQTFSTIEFLEDFKVCDPEKLNSPLVQDAIQGHSPTTINYSKYLANEQDWTDSREIDYSHDAEFDEKINRLLLECSPDSMETLSLDCFYWRMRPPLADKIPRLKTLQLDDLAIHRQDVVDNIVNFIRAHHTAFPGKKRLQIEFMDDRNVRFIDTDLAPGSDDMLLIRERDHKKKKFRIALYEAIGDPSDMSASKCPGFYALAGNIGLDSLLKFTDRDYHRIIYGEGPQQADFFKRCDNLKALELAIRDPSTLSWALERKPDGSAQRHQENYLRNLERLFIHMHASLNVVDDAISAFGHSQLHHLKVAGRLSPQEISTEIPLSPEYLKGIQVGGWTLPFLRTLSVDIVASTRVLFDRFDQCPCLETLSLRIRSDRKEISAITSRFSNPARPVPIWRLPRLTSLKLYCKAALLFDFDTLDHIPALEHLVMVSAGDEQPVPDVYLPRLMAYRSCKSPPKINDRAPDPAANKWKDCWSLQRLKSIHLEGPLSWVFCFQWLISCPSLESIHLTTRGDFQRLPLSLSSENASIVLNKSPTKRQSGTDPENVEDSGFKRGMAPLVDSKLQRITLQGPWVMSEHDLSKVLTVYAPNLVSLKVDMIHAVSPQQQTSWHGFQFLKVVTSGFGSGGTAKQDKKNGAEHSSASATQVRSGSKLKYIASTYNLNNGSRNDFKDLGLVYIRKGALKEHQKKGACIFEFETFGLVKLNNKGMDVRSAKTTRAKWK